MDTLILIASFSPLIVRLGAVVWHRVRVRRSST
jgi:hypothetical protein